MSSLSEHALRIFVRIGNKYANGLYVKATPPNLDRGLTIVNAEAGIMSIGGDYRFGSWSLTTVSAEAKAGASLDYIGFCADAALIRGEAGVRIKLPFTKKKLFLGAGLEHIMIPNEVALKLVYLML